MPPRGTTRATVSADWLNLCQQPYCLVGVCLLRRRLGPPPKTVVGVSKSMRLLNLCSKNLVMTANKKQMAPSPRQPLSGQGVRRISGLGGNEVWELECGKYMWKRNGGLRRATKEKRRCMLHTGSEMER